MKSKVQPDLVTTELKKGFEWSSHHTKGLGIVVGTLFLMGAAGATYSYVDEKKETRLQEKYSQLEADYLKKKEQFELFESSTKTPAEQKKGEKAAAPQGVKASGDLATDYGALPSQLEGLVQEAPGSKGSALAALLAADLYKNHNKPTEGIAVLNKVKSSKGAMGIFVRTELGTLMANSQNCESAMQVWSEVTSDSSAKFIWPQVRLKMAACSEKMGQKQKAEDLYKQIIADAKDSSSGKSAEKFLRILQATSSTKE